MLTDKRLVRGASRVDNLDHALIGSLVMPVGPQRNDLFVEFRRILPRRTHHHRLAGPADERLHQFATHLPVFYEVASKFFEPLRRPVHGVEHRHALL